MFNFLFYNIIFTFCFHIACKAQVEWKSNKNEVSIPFEFLHNLIIVDIEVNDVKLNMIFDTGSERNFLFSFPEKDSISFNDTRKIKIKGISEGDYVEAFFSKHNKMKMIDLYDYNFEVLLIVNQDISIVNKFGIPINGILGANFLKDYLIEVDYLRRKLIIHRETNYSLNRKLKKYHFQDLEIINDKPFINLSINLNNHVNEFKLLIDTGLSDGLWLFENDTINCSSSFFIDVLGRGIGGDIIGKRSRVEMLSFQNFAFSKALVSYPDSLLINTFDIIEGRNGSLGGEILKRFNCFLDYKNKRFYFKKNKFFNLPFNYNMSGIEIQHNGMQWVQEVVRIDNALPILNVDEFVFENSNRRFNFKYVQKPVYEIYAIRKDSPAYKSGLMIGDKIVNINNRKAYQYSIQKITDLFQSEEGKLITIEVDRKGKILKFKFKLEKIL